MRRSLLVSGYPDVVRALSNALGMTAERLQCSQFPRLQAAQQPGLRVVHVHDETSRNLPL